MAIFFIVVLILILSLVLWGIADRDDLFGLSFISAFFAISTGIALVVMSVSLINIGRKFDSFVNRYEYTKQLVVAYEPNDYGNKTALLEDVLEINRKIADHKALAGNKWTGKWYSEKIGNLEPIVFNGKTPAVSIEMAE